ncbi:MAG TPA: MotA/TolQ/ExbB proton channel family protein [Treponema sp.]|nr:MotA/TolQ/ExbB proton channel family protein [Treponema sp.]HPC70482.1 MotA/TolQ/ExbB proton channel family protein [Treponema sp.]HRS03365.1 MotA/TolQ/ExbB proton channel family protein [Treponema sp.]HRU28698.1 MotA/TolQ/ExbB proton channel family protein [Treponema sp.]
MLDLFVKGGPVMYVIALCALGATVIIVERFLFFRLLVKHQKEFLPRLQQLLRSGQFEQAEELCRSSDVPLARLAGAALEQRKLDEGVIKEAVLNAANRQVPRVERYISALGTIANISTLLGLLGTVSGNIRAFGVLAASGAMGNPSLLAGAIAEALITTAAGLIVSIPATVFYNYFVSRANSSIIDLESTVGDLVLLVLSHREGT